jgi:hypothetical protein
VRRCPSPAPLAQVLLQQLAYAEQQLQAMAARLQAAGGAAEGPGAALPEAAAEQLAR